MLRLTLLLCLPVLGSSAACSTAGRASLVPEPRPLSRDLDAYRAPAPGSADPVGPETAVAPDGVLTLRAALAAALLGSPDLASASWETRAAEARELQAGLLPNPELEFELENFGGDGELSGFSAIELTLALSQEIPLAGKLGRRSEVARIEGRLAGWEYEAARLAVLTETSQAFVHVLAAQESVGIAEESVRVSGEVARAVREQVAAGKSPPLEERKASVEHSLAQLALDRARRELESARRRLAASWGGESAEFTSATGDLHRTAPVPAEERLASFLAEGPDLARLDDEVDLTRARVEAAKAEAWPDITVTGGVKRFEEIDLHAFLAGFSIPLPLFDRNQGGIRDAMSERRRADERRRREVVRVRTGFARAWRDLAVAEREATSLRESVLPAAEAAFAAAREGFRQGKFGYLDVLDAQRTLFLTRAQLVQALAAYHVAVADVERLIGRSLNDATNDAGDER